MPRPVKRFDSRLVHRRLAWLCLWGAVGCAHRPGGDAVLPVSASDARPDAPVILALVPDARSARQTLEGIVEELGADFRVVPRVVPDDLEPETLVEWMRREAPRAVVVMNNPILRLFRRYREVAPPSQRDLPAVAVLSSFLRETSAGIPNLTGIIYEVPLVTSLTNLRAILDQPIRKVGVLYRPPFGAFIEEQRRLAAAEGFELVALPVKTVTPWDIESGLETLREERGVDAIWVMNDNALLDPELLSEAWLPALRYNQRPVVVNVRSLVSRSLDLGTFAVIPDHRALGSQAGQMLWNLSESEWRIPSDEQLEYPVSVEKALDLGFARENLALRETELSSIDQLVQ